MLADWHRRKTEIYTEMVAAGPAAGAAGCRADHRGGPRCRLALAVASTSAEASVRAVLDHVAGADHAARFALVLAGDVVPKKKPAPDIYQLALARLGVEPADALVIEDSRNGMLAAVGAGLRLRRHRQQLHGGRGLHRGGAGRLARSAIRTASRTKVLANHGVREPGDFVDPRRPAVVSDRATGASELSDREVWMAEASPNKVELVVRTIAQTAVDNEKYFGDLDAVVGDGDFGFSLARGFEIVLADWDSLRPHRCRDVPEEDRGA